MDDLRTRFGRRVRELRKRRKWSLAKLGERAGLHPNSIQQIETAKVSATLDAIEGIARALELSEYELFLLKHPPKVLRGRLLERVEQLPDDSLAWLTMLLDVTRD